MAKTAKTAKMANADGGIDGRINDRKLMKEAKFGGIDGCIDGGIDGCIDGVTDDRTIKKVKSDDDVNKVYTVDFKPLLRQVSTKILGPNYWKPYKASQKILKEVAMEVVDFAQKAWEMRRKPEPERTAGADHSSADGRRMPSPSNPFLTGW